MEGEAGRLTACDYGEILQAKGIPPVGETVRCRETGTLWRIMDREVWHRLEEDPLTRASRVVPCFYVSFWRIESGVPPGVGQMLGQLFALQDDNFMQLWEVLSFPEIRSKWLN